MKPTNLTSSSSLQEINKEFNNFLTQLNIEIPNLKTGTVLKDKKLEKERLEQEIKERETIANKILQKIIIWVNEKSQIGIEKNRICKGINFTLHPDKLNNASSKNAQYLKESLLSHENKGFYFDRVRTHFEKPKEELYNFSAYRWQQEELAKQQAAAREAAKREAAEREAAEREAAEREAAEREAAKQEAAKKKASKKQAKKEQKKNKKTQQFLNFLKISLDLFLSILTFLIKAILALVCIIILMMLIMNPIAEVVIPIICITVNIISFFSSIESPQSAYQEKQENQKAPPPYAKQDESSDWKYSYKPYNFPPKPKNPNSESDSSFESEEESEDRFPRSSFRPGFEHADNLD